MISGFTIILEDKILYCSNDQKYNAFEIILFVEKFLRSINPKNTWRLKKICLKGQEIGRERIIVHHIVTPANQNLFFCIIGDFTVGSQESYKLLNEFVDKVNFQYSTPDELKFASEEPVFYNVLNLITAYLKSKYSTTIEEEIIDNDKGYFFETRVLYAGISAQGLPIISQLYDVSLLKNLEKERTKENIELFSSDLSAKLATISMNTQIRANTKIKEIHIGDTNGNSSERVILFGEINGYSLDFIASGDFYKNKEIFKYLKSKLSLENTFTTEFSGDLRPFQHLGPYMSNIIKEFN